MKHRGAAEGEARRSDGRVRRASLQVDDLVLDERRVEARLEARRLDANREGVHGDRAARRVVEDALVAFRHALRTTCPEHPAACGMKVPCVIIDVEADEIGA